MKLRVFILTLLLALVLCGPVLGQFTDSKADRDALPTVPAGFEVKLFAREPLVRQPCSMAFDARGRLFVGMGPQYRNPKPDTPGDSVVMVSDEDGDGVADKTQVFATGFNCIQGLAWHGRDLWVANVPDLTIVRDLDGNDEADEYVRVYTDLGNLEHGLHGLNFAPDGKLYMSKGNSKGLTRPGRIAPKPFRDLWGVTAPPGSPDFPEPVTYQRGQYEHAYHNPADDWGREGGVLRCDDGGRNLEIVSRGMRNPWDIAMDDGFNWLGTDNDQTEGDRVFTPFWGAHFGWNHPWSSHWTDEPHLPTAPVSGPLFEGSGTGIVFCDSPQFPPEYRRVFFINDWLRKTTFVWKPAWEGALLRPDGETWQPFIEGGKSLFRPTDLEIGPDGTLWILGWGSGYGAEWNNGQLTNEGRIFRVSWKDTPPANWNTPQRTRPLMNWSVAELIEDFRGPLPVWRIDAADELVRRGSQVKDELTAALRSGKLTTMQETWTAWTLGRIEPDDATIADFFSDILSSKIAASLILRIQAVRILAFRVREHGVATSLPDAAVRMMRSDEPRLRHAAIEAIVQGRQSVQVPAVLDLLSQETDRVVFYSAWQGLRELQSQAELKVLLNDPRGGVRRAALLALLETNALPSSEVARFASDDDAGVREIAGLRLNKHVGGSVARPKAAAPPAVSLGGVSLVDNIKARSDHAYLAVPGGLYVGARAYSDRAYTFTQVPEPLVGAELLQTSNEDDGSSGKSFLTFDALVPVQVHVGYDTRIKTPPPAWLRESFRAGDLRIATNDCSFVLYSGKLPAGRVELGGNTEDGKPGGKSNYVVIVEPLPLPKLDTPTTLAEGLERLPAGDVRRGELLFKQVAGCAKCHSLEPQNKNPVGPQLSDIGLRAVPKHIIESIVAPDTHITEGFSQLVIETIDGKVYSGVLIDESGLSLTLGLPTAERIVLGKEKIESRNTSNRSAMPSFSQTLTPVQVADVAAFLLTQKAKPNETIAQPVATAANATLQPPETKPAAESLPQTVKPTVDADAKFGLNLKSDRLEITHEGAPLAEFVFHDPKILRPYFANVYGPKGTKITRNNPPLAGKDSADHDTMHPGIWLGFGDVSGHDFWRNRGTIEHLRFVAPPQATKDRVTFATECQLQTPDGTALAGMENRITLTHRPAGWLLVWSATFRADHRDFYFGDQEEMGFGARVATQCIEKNGGAILNSRGKRTAKDTWGQPAAWCDYSGTKDGQRVGILLMASPRNFRESWWHNRDYGVFVANPFGRAAMRQGAKSEVVVKRGESLELTFAALIHDTSDFDPASEFRHFLELCKPIQ